MKVEKIAIEKVVPYENNAKEHPEEQIQEIMNSIKRFGNNDPIAIDENNMIIEGHGRLMALQELGYKEVDIIRLSHLTDEQKRAYSLVHNKLTTNTGYDMDILMEELASIENFDMSDLGFDDLEDELAEFIDPVVEDEDYEIEVPDEPESARGDIYQLGRHRLMCGSSTEQIDVEKLMDGELVDMFLTDPPYNVEYVGKTADALTIENDAMEDSNFRQFLVDAFRSADSVMKEGAVFYIWHADSEGYNFSGACRDVDWQVRQCLIWNKNSMVMGRQDYHWKHEPCLYGWKSGGAHLWNNDRKQVTILEFDRPSRSKEHPTMKPVLLFDYQIKNNTKQGDIVYDAFGGSGTTIIACEENGRTGYVMELDPRYVDVIINRWESLTGEEAVKLN